MERKFINTLLRRIFYVINFIEGERGDKKVSVSLNDNGEAAH